MLCRPNFHRNLHCCSKFVSSHLPLPICPLCFVRQEPFVELIKGSLNTFLNAMTFPDKTCYPVARI